MRATNVERWRGGVGVEITGGGADFTSVDPSDIRSLLLEDGLVLLRGYRVTVEALHAFTEGLYDRRLIYGGVRQKVTDDDAIQTVELGFHRLGLHSEMAYTPMRPDVAVFHCVTPAADGGETLVGDGCAIYDAMSPATRELLEAQRARYHNAITQPAWQRMFGTEDPSVLAAVLDAVPDLSWEMDGQGTLTASHLFPSIAAGRRGGRSAFADSLHRFPGEEPQDFLFGLKKTWTALEGGPLAPEVREELHRLCDGHEVEVGWQPGDVLVLDNWSVMHGRTAFQDPNRQILSSFGYASWAAP